METLDWVTCKMWNKNFFIIWNSNLERWFMRGKEKPGKTNCGKIVEVRVNLWETGMGRVLSLRIPVLFNLRCSMKLTQKKNKKKQKYIYISYEIFTDIKASRDKFSSLVSTLYRIRKVSKPWYFDFTGWVEVPFVPPGWECKRLRG